MEFGSTNSEIISNHFECCVEINLKIIWKSNQQETIPNHFESHSFINGNPTNSEIIPNHFECRWNYESIFLKITFINEEESEEKAFISTLLS
jgi:hypothetical protein